MKPQDRDIRIFSGSANRPLARAICGYLGVAEGQITLKKFSDGETYCQVIDNVRGNDVFVIQPTCPPVNENLMELLLMIDAFKRSSADRITAVIPYYGYARQDRKDKPRVPISAKLVADLMSAAGTDRILAVDLHAPAIQGFFDIPVDHLFAAPVFVNHFEKMRIPDLMIVSPDAGGVERARAYAKRLNANLAIVDKRRTETGQAQLMHLIGDVHGKNTLIVDDIVDTATTLSETVKALHQHGAKDIYACFTHGVLSGSAVEKLAASKLSRTLVTDTIPIKPEVAQAARIEVLSVAELLGEAIYRIHNNSSVSSLFI
ncbi:MAG TPA: ribose-phosphate pyrophosphokinase [Candidatus Polarisedimenticolia bacterium]|nr:ribose-phosphate pyrophosphokinase [Candidatus Polarisedimenticolia bacterium]